MKKLAKILTLTILASTLAACSGSRGVEELPKLIFLAPSLKEPCADPRDLSPFAETGMTQLEIESAWGLDRRNLRECSDKHRLVVQTVEEGSEPEN